MNLWKWIFIKMLLSVIKDWYSFLEHTFWQSEQNLRAIMVPVSYWARTPIEPRNLVQLCNIVVEGCKFSFWRKFSERRTWTWSLVWFDSGHQAWYGFMRPCAVCSVHCAICYVICDMALRCLEHPRFPPFAQATKSDNGFMSRSSSTLQERPWSPA